MTRDTKVMTTIGGKDIAVQVQRKPNAMEIMASRLAIEPGKLSSTLRETVFKGANEAEFMALCVIANELRLNPLKKELYAFPSKGSIVPMVSIDGWIVIADRHPMMDGSEENYIYEEDDNGRKTLVACETTIWRKDRTHPIKRTAFLSEYKRNTEPWKMEHLMLGHKSFKLAARYAFGLSGGIYDEDDAEMLNVTPAKDIAVLPTREEIAYDPETGEILPEDEPDEMHVDEQTGLTVSDYEVKADALLARINALEIIADYNKIAEEADLLTSDSDCPSEIAGAINLELRRAKERLTGRPVK